VLHLNTHRLTSRIFDLTSYSQDGGHDVITHKSATTLASKRETSDQRLCSRVDNS